MTYYNEAGLLILGTRFKRLSERFLSEVSKVYKKIHIRFETSWFPVFYLLYKKGSLTLTEIAEHLQISHSAVSQMISNLKSRGIVETLSDISDERKKHIRLSQKSKEMLPGLVQIWEALENSLYELMPSVSDRENFLSGLLKLEQELNKNTFSEKTINQLKKVNRKIQTIPYSSDYEQVMNNFLINENLDNNINQKNITLALADGEITGFVTYNLSNENLIVDKLYISKMNNNTKMAALLLSELSEKYLQKKGGYFIIKKPDEITLRYFLKAGYPFMVK